MKIQAETKKKTSALGAAQKPKIWNSLLAQRPPKYAGRLCGARRLENTAVRFRRWASDQGSFFSQKPVLYEVVVAT